MSLPERIWWCVPHGSPGDREWCDYAAEHAQGDAHDRSGCRMVEVELHPVGSRVAGPDDLLEEATQAGYDYAVTFAPLWSPDLAELDWRGVIRAALSVLFPGDAE